GDRDASVLEQLLVSVRETDLTNRRGCLTLPQAQRPGGQSEVTAPQRHGAGRHEYDLLSAPPKAQQVGDEALEPRTVEPTGLGVDQQRRANLDDDPMRAGQGTGPPH